MYVNPLPILTFGYSDKQKLQLNVDKLRHMHKWCSKQTYSNKKSLELINKLMINIEKKLRIFLLKKINNYYEFDYNDYIQNKLPEITVFDKMWIEEDFYNKYLKDKYKVIDSYNKQSFDIKYDVCDDILFESIEDYITQVFDTSRKSEIFYNYGIGEIYQCRESIMLNKSLILDIIKEKHYIGSTSFVLRMIVIEKK
jgi:hypothetical protein